MNNLLSLLYIIPESNKAGLVFHHFFSVEEYLLNKVDKWLLLKVVILSPGLFFFSRSSYFGIYQRKGSQ